MQEGRYEFCGHKPFYSISVSGAFLGTSLPPTPNWSRFDLYIYVYSKKEQKAKQNCIKERGILHALFYNM
jgi:hypothetical protein